MLRLLPDADLNYLYSKYPELPRSYRDGCPACGGVGQVLYKGEVLTCDCKQQLWLHKLYLDAGVGENYHYLSPADWHGDPNAYSVVFSYIQNMDENIPAGKGLMFLGGIGIGKTFAATLVLKEAIKRGYVCYSTTAADLVRSIKDGWHDPSFDQWYKSKVDSARVLMIDDLGKELIDQAGGFNDKYAKRTIESLIRTRVQQSRPTIITTNFEWDEVSEVYSKALVSLITESMGRVTFVGEDYRKIQSNLWNKRGARVVW